MKKNNIQNIWAANRILLGLLMLIPGLMKLFAFKPAGVTGMLSGMGFPLPVLFAWILIIAEIGSGVAILAKWKIKQVIALPTIILLVAALTAHLGDWSRIIMHLALITNYLLIANKK